MARIAVAALAGASAACGGARPVATMPDARAIAGSPPSARPIAYAECLADAVANHRYLRAASDGTPSCSSRPRSRAASTRAT